MISRVDLRGKQAGADTYRDVLPRAALDVGTAVDVVRPICDDVRARGADAVREATGRLDGVDVTATPVPAAALARALADLDPAVRAALEEAIRRARLVHEAQRRSDVTVEVVPGGTVTERWLPVRRVGLYVPGGLLAYPSSVVMNVVPAQVAGVRSLAVASPPQAEYGGLPHPAVLAACALLGIDEVHAVGGAQAVAMFAYGTADCERVDLVTGPGNVYVAAAKRLLRGVVGIDAEAGPTEIAILADDSADPRAVAADLIAQAEHDPNASCLLVTPSAELLDAVDRELATPGGGDPAPGPGRDGAAQPVGTRPGRRPRAGAHRRRRVGGGAPGGADPRRSRLGRPGHRSRRHLRRRLTRPSRSATTSPAPTTSCRPGAPPGTPAGCPCSRSCTACTSSSTTRARWPARRRTSTPSVAPRTCPRTSPPCGSACRDRAGTGMSRP